MKPVVLDACLVAKLVFPERGSEPAAGLVRECVSSGVTLHAPDLLFAELANLGWKKIRRGEATRDDALALLRVARALGIRGWPSAVLADAALLVACEVRCSVYDALYVALAHHVGGLLHTADARLVAAMRAGPFRNLVKAVP